MLEWLLRPMPVFLALGALLVLTILLTPDPNLAEDAAQLTSYSTGRSGARGFYEVAERLGWRVEQRETPFREALDPTRIYAVLAPPIEQTAVEVHHLLEAVRDGAGLLYALPYAQSPLADSLGLTVLRSSFAAYQTDPEPPRASPLAERFADLYDLVPRRAVKLDGPLHDDTQIFVYAIDVTDSVRAPVIVGLPFGDGRVVVVADPELLRNDRIREDEFGLLPVRLLEWLSPDGRRTIVFDEYHHGFGRQPSLSRAVGMLLTETAPGRALAQLTIAVLLLLLAAATRGLAPPSRRRTERRSPLEHVGALARAYEQVEATRIATRRLVHGLRRRHATGAARALDDEAFLHALAARHPALAPQVERAIGALQHPVPPPEFLAVGEAIDHIDRTLRT